MKDDGQVEGEDDFFSQEFLDDENDSSEEGSDAVNTSETTQDNVSTWKSKQEFLRQRKQTYQVKDSACAFHPIHCKEFQLSHSVDCL